MFQGENGWVGLIGAGLFIILAYNILRNWQGAVAIENSSLSGGAQLVKALQGR
jgi:hypothetical protein